MAQTSVVQVRLDSELKSESERLFEDLGLDIPSAIRLFLKQSLAYNGIPFALTRKNDAQIPEAPESVRLSQSEWDRFWTVMENPPKPNAALKKLIKRHSA